MRLVKALGSAQASENAVTLACDEGHLPFASFAADRILRAEPRGGFDVVICMPDISCVPDRLLDRGIRFCEVDFSSMPEVPMVKAWISKGTYFRWMLPTVFNERYRTLLYLDTDTYLRRAGLRKLFDGIAGPVALAATAEFQHYGSVDAHAEQSFRAKIRDLGGAGGEYYNAGVLVVQPEHFLAMDGPRRYVDAVRRNVEYLPMHKDQDQGAMNLAFANDIVPLSPLYNWCSKAWLHAEDVERYDPHILHFAGRAKPWNLNDQPFVMSFAPEYLSFLDVTFPGFAPKAALKSAAWRRENPRHRLAFLEDIRVRLFLRRFRKTLRLHEGGNRPQKYAKMDRAINEAAVG